MFYPVLHLLEILNKSERNSYSCIIITNQELFIFTVLQFFLFQRITNYMFLGEQ